MRRLIKTLFSGPSAPRATPTRPTVRLEVEHLDERVLLSNTGSVSSIYAPNVYVDGNGYAQGATVVYSIDTDKNLYESVNGQFSRRVDNGYCDLQVTAGTDQYGRAVAYVLNTYGSLWALTTYANGSWGPPTLLSYTHISDNVVFDPRNHWSSISAAFGRNYQTGDTGGVFFISGGNDFLFQFGRPIQLLSAAGVDYEISAGTDQAGFDVMYVLNGVDHNVYERYAVGSWTQIPGINGGGMQIAGSVNNIVYILWDPEGSTNNGPYLVHEDQPWLLGGSYDILNTTGYVMMWDGHQLNAIYTQWYPASQGAYQISAGTDAWGQSTVNFLVATAWWGADPNWRAPYLGDAYHFDTVGWSTYLYATNARQVCGGQGALDYSVDAYGNLDQFYWWEGSTRMIGYNVWWWF
jgi:hypothetical protein